MTEQGRYGVKESLVSRDVLYDTTLLGVSVQQASVATLSCMIHLLFQRRLHLV